MSPGRPPPPSVKKMTGRRECCGDLEQPVFLAMILRALRSGENGVVVREHRATCMRLVEQVTVHAADARDHPVGRCLLDEILNRPTAALSGDDQRPVFDERPGVDQIVDVLARGAMSGLSPAGNGVGPTIVQADGMSIERFGEVRPHGVEIDIRGALVVMSGVVGCVEQYQQASFEDRITG